MTLSSKSIKKLDSLLTDAVGRNEPGIAVGISMHGRVLWRGARGLSNSIGDIGDRPLLFCSPL